MQFIMGISFPELDFSEASNKCKELNNILPFKFSFYCLKTYNDLPRDNIDIENIPLIGIEITDILLNSLTSYQSNYSTMNSNIFLYKNNNLKDIYYAVQNIDFEKEPEIYIIKD